MTEKLYQRYDELDENEGMIDFDIETLDQMRNWLADFWKENP